MRILAQRCTFVNSSTLSDFPTFILVHTKNKNLLILKKNNDILNI